MHLLHFNYSNATSIWRYLEEEKKDASINELLLCARHFTYIISLQQDHSPLKWELLFLFVNVITEDQHG